MEYNEKVRGTQQIAPADIERNGTKVYARAGIVRVDEGEGDEEFHGWEYEEAVLSTEEFSRFANLDSSWIVEWNSALRTAERRARYERMDPKVSSLRRLIDLGIDVEANTTKLMSIQTYCRGVTETQNQVEYPAEVVYPEEP